MSFCWQFSEHIKFLQCLQEKKKKNKLYFTNNLERLFSTLLVFSSVLSIKGLFFDVLPICRSPCAEGGALSKSSVFGRIAVVAINAPSLYLFCCFWMGCYATTRFVWKWGKAVRGSWLRKDTGNSYSGLLINLVSCS